MRISIRHALFAGLLGVVALSVLLTGALVAWGLRRDLEARLASELRAYLALAELTLAESGVRDAHALALRISDRIGYRVALIDTDGIVLGDSHVAPGRVGGRENLRNRPDVRAVLDGGERTSLSTQDEENAGSPPLLHGSRRVLLDGRPAVLRITLPRTELDEAVGRSYGVLTVAGLLGMLLALGAAHALSGQLAGPLVRLAHRTRGLSDGDFAAPLPASRITEIGDLTAAFRRLRDDVRRRLGEIGRDRDQMQTLIDRLGEGVVALTDDGRVLRTNPSARELLGIPEEPRFAPIGSVIRHPGLREVLKASVTRAEQSREIEVGDRHILLASRALPAGGSVTTLLDITELRRVERVRRDFVANASHELKTPLTAIRGYAETLSEEDPPEDMRRQFLSSILNNTLRLQRLVDDLLDLSRLESGGWSATIEPVDVGEVVREAWGLVASGGDRSVDFDVTGDGVVSGDRQGLVQIFRNLLENAVRHSDPGGRIRVDINGSGGQSDVEISVSDDGEGIAAQALPRIFERFYRTDSARGRDAGGTGLGLAIVKHLVDAMRGDIRAESELGGGTTVTLRLPGA